MKFKSYAKVNLSLDVTGKREDGYHLLKMVMQSISLYDEIDIELTPESGVILTTDKPYIPVDDRNIAKKAADLFLKKIDSDKGVKIHITKNIPVAAGLAGGSTNGGTVLRVLNKLFGYPISEDELLKLGLELGADVPFTMIGGTALCEGVGEIITNLKDFSNHTLVLVKPPFGISTGSVFKSLKVEMIRIHPETEKLIEAIEEDNLESAANYMKNVLENVSLNKHPILRKIKTDLVRYGALTSLMTGSGPSVFGFFDDDEKAFRASNKMMVKNPETFVIKTIDRGTVNKDW
ncbi:MAG: 4-(cytidine 5'-diphospho)-2-C-methyl-D-erythritol kinase [Clostridiaceae bacterium]